MPPNIAQTINDVTEINISEEYYTFIKHLASIGIGGWEPLIDKICFSPQIKSTFSIETIRVLGLLNQAAKKRIKESMKNVRFWSSHYTSSDLIKHRRIPNIVMQVFDGDFNELSTINLGNNVAATNLYNSVINCWKNPPDEHPVNDVWKQVENNESFEFLWNIAKDPSNKLMTQIINKAIATKKDYFFLNFSYEDVFKPAYNLIEIEDEKEKLINYFLSKVEFKKELSTADIDVKADKGIVLDLVNRSDNKEFYEKISNKLANYNKEDWIDVFTHNNLEIQIVTTLFNKGVTWENHYEYCEALKEMLSKWAKSPPGIITKNNFDTLVNLMTSEFIDEFKKHVNVFLESQSFNISDVLKEMLINNFDVTGMFSSHKEFYKNAVHQALIENSYNKLLLLKEMLEKDTEKVFKPERGWKTVLKTPFNRCYNDNDGERVKSTVQYLADKFKVKIEEEEEVDGDDPDSSPEEESK